MKWNTNMKQMVNGKKVVYPTKRTMNLYFKVDRTTAPATAALYVLFALVVLLALSKVAIYDPLEEARQLEERVLMLEEQTASQMERLKNYHQIQEDYIRATPTEEELSQVDRMEILNLIDSTIRPAAKIAQVSISGDQVLLTFSDVTLEEAAGLVSKLEASKLVAKTSVDTAISTRENQKHVKVDVYFEVSKGEETQP